jgi:hypothetical protein
MPEEIRPVPTGHCVACFHKLEATTATAGDLDAKPNPGDFTICFYCGTPMRFGATLQLQGVTPQELDELPDEDRRSLLRVMRAVSERIRMKRRS